VNILSDLIRRGSKSLSYTFLGLLVLLISVHYCIYPILNHWILYRFAVLLAAIQITLVLETFLVTFVSKILAYRDNRLSTEDLESKYAVLYVILKGLLWILMGLLYLENIGVEVKVLIAGLGVGGLAMALAVKSTLQDLMSAVSILVDKPFETGDVVLVGDIRGTVEKIGIKSTHIRSSSGEVVIISNSNMIKSRIHNFKQMNYRRSIFTLHIDFFTPPELLKILTDKIKYIIGSIEMTRFDRAHFSAIGQSCLKIEVVYFVNSREYVMLMDIQQKINLYLLEELNTIGIRLAYPRKKVGYINGSRIL
jgi:small-conductance mechanosensitive channel